jgi:hypothetical protein
MRHGIALNCRSTVKESFVHAVIGNFPSPLHTLAGRSKVVLQNYSGSAEDASMGWLTGLSSRLKELTDGPKSFTQGPPSNRRSFSRFLGTPARLHRNFADLGTGLPWSIATARNFVLVFQSEP